MGERYDNIRQSPVGKFLGARVVEITQHDRDEAKDDGNFYVALHFDNGGTLTFPVSDVGFDIETMEDA